MYVDYDLYVEVYLWLCLQIINCVLQVYLIKLIVKTLNIFFHISIIFIEFSLMQIWYNILVPGFVQLYCFVLSDIVINEHLSVKNLVFCLMLTYADPCWSCYSVLFFRRFNDLTFLKVFGIVCGTLKAENKCCLQMFS